MGNTTIPAPIVFSPSQAWDGNDGSWSTFIVRIGTPEQNFRVLPSTAGQETWIPVPEGCTSDDNDPSNCGQLRGVYPFDGVQGTGFTTGNSSSWKSIGLYDLQLEHEMNMTGAGNYGLDTVGLMIQNSGGPSFPTQVVAGIATKDFYLGIFGLSPKPSNFTDFEYPQPSYMRTLKDNNRIPSLSYGYTAGAANRIPKLPGSLTLGGYDKSRFTANEITFPFGTDDSRVLTIGIQSVTASNTLTGTVTLLSNQILSLIDSTVPQIWLPRTVCDSFEQAFGLTYDPHTDLYLVNSTIHNTLQTLKPSVSFVLGNTGNPADTISITLLYSAFDLQARHPIYENATNYFPLRRAANDTQYVLGRTFLQEAYIIADYERSNFSIYQARFGATTPSQSIVSILSPGIVSNTTDTPNASNGSSTIAPGAIAGIAIGAVAILVLLAGAFFYIHRRRTRSKPSPAPVELAGGDSVAHIWTPGAVQGQELMSEQKHEMASPGAVHEIGAGEKKAYLMSDDAVGETVHEMPVSEVEPPVRIVVTSGTVRDRKGE